MPDLEKVKAKAKRVIPPLVNIAYWDYESPLEKSKSKTAIAIKAEKDFVIVREKAEETYKVLQNKPKLIVQDRGEIQKGMVVIEESFKNYERPFIANNKADRVAKLEDEVNKALRNWEKVVKEMDK
jgi:hypothetical protein